MFYARAYQFWSFAKWVWNTLIITTIACLIANLAVLQSTDFSKTFLFRWFAEPGPAQKTLLIIFALFLSSTLISRAIVARENRHYGDEPLRKYLRFVVNVNERLNTTAIAQMSQDFITPNVPLDDIFIAVDAVFGRPVYQLPGGQQKKLVELRQHLDLNLTHEQRQRLIQRLQVTWHSQVGQPSVKSSQIQQHSIPEVLKHLSEKHPSAVILGSPGSGKSITIRWLAPSGHMLTPLPYGSPQASTHASFRLFPCFSACPW